MDWIVPALIFNFLYRGAIVCSDCDEIIDLGDTCISKWANIYCRKSRASQNSSYVFALSWFAYWCNCATENQEMLHKDFFSFSNKSDKPSK